MSNNKLTMARLNKQQQRLLRQPMQNAMVIRQNYLNFHFCIYNLDGVYKNGFYHGMLQLHPNYPFAAPKLFFYTPNGRYQINMAICTSFTSYHQQSWTSAWNVRTLVQGTISFMLCEDGSYGCRSDTSQIRKQYAKQSLSYNYRNQKFVQLFDDQIKKNLASFEKLGIQIHDPNLKKLIYQKGALKQQMLLQEQEVQKQPNSIISQERQRSPYNYNQQNVEQIVLQQRDTIQLHQLLLGQIELVDQTQNVKRRNARNRKIKSAIIGGSIILLASVGAIIAYKFVK